MCFEDFSYQSDVIPRLDLMDKVVSNWPEPFVIVQCCLELFGVFPTLGRSVSVSYSFHHKPIEYRNNDIMDLIPKRIRV